MRTATMQDFEALKSALAELARATNAGALESIAANDTMHAMAEAGQSEAGDFGAEKLTELQLAYSGATAKYQKAVQAFLGEARQPWESMDTYAGRISLVLGDLPAMLSMQQRNGVRFQI